MIESISVSCVDDDPSRFLSKFRRLFSNVLFTTTEFVRLSVRILTSFFKQMSLGTVQAHFQRLLPPLS